MIVAKAIVIEEADITGDSAVGAGASTQTEPTPVAKEMRQTPLGKKIQTGKFGTAQRLRNTQASIGAGTTQRTGHFQALCAGRLRRRRSTANNSGICGNDC